MQEYYMKKRQWTKQLKYAVKVEEINKYQFVVRPSHGTCVIDFNNYTLEQMVTKKKE